MVQTWFFSSLALLYGLFSGTLAFNTGALWGAAAGVLVVVGYYNFLAIVMNATRKGLPEGVAEPLKRYPE